MSDQPFQFTSAKPKPTQSEAPTQGGAPTERTVAKPAAVSRTAKTVDRRGSSKTLNQWDEFDIFFEILNILKDHPLEVRQRVVKALDRVFYE